MNDDAAAPAAPAMPEGIDPTSPSPARLYDYFLGGKNNYAADREAAGKLLAAFPEIRMGARANRAFMVRAVELMCANGVDQFLDIGAGLRAARRLTRRNFGTLRQP